jgi:hypothetical protein
VISLSVLVSLGVVLVSFALASGCVVGAVATLAARSPAPVRRPRPAALQAALVFAPALLGVLGCAAVAFPEPFAGCHCTVHGLHHPHLCGAHPGFAVSLVAPAATLLGIWIAIAAPGVYRLARDGITSARWARAVRRLPVVWLDGVALRLADCGVRGAFTIGALSPVVVFDRVLWRSLSEEARRAIAHHERGHAERRDGLTVVVLRLCIAFFPMPGGRRLLDAWRAAAEHACDRYAAAKLGDSAAVAAALVTVERVRALSPQQAAIPAPALGVLAGSDLERRVLLLLESDGRDSGQPLLANDVLAAAIVTAGAFVLTIAWPGDAIHHAIETLIGHLIP